MGLNILNSSLFRSCKCKVFVFTLQFKVLLMKPSQEYLRDLADIRAMMERSTKFLSLSGLAGILAGLLALAGAYIVHTVFQFDPGAYGYNAVTDPTVLALFPKVILLASAILALSIGAAILLSIRKARQRNEKVWNATSRQLLLAMAVPLIAGGLLILILIAQGLIGLVVPLTLIFYGIALWGAGFFTYHDVKALGLIQIGLGLMAALFIQYSLLIWAIGFGIVHVIYGIYMHFKYER